MQYKKIILSWQKEILETKIIKRNIEILFDDLFKLQKILVLVWTRRAWKTFFMYQIAQELISIWKIKKEQIVYINFTNILFFDFNIEKLLEEYFGLFPDLKPVFFLDEIQELENFDKNLLYLKSKWYQIFTTWSNSKLLSSEISTNLRWKYLERFIFPLDFKEFLKFKNVEFKNFILEEEVWKIKKLFLEFLKWWWFPEVVLSENKTTKRDLLNSYFNNMIFIDIIERYNIENEKVLKELITKVFKNIWKEISVHKIFNDFKSRWFKIGKNTIYNYLWYLEDIFLISELKNFYKQNNRKIYLYDTWFLLLLAEEENFWQRFENYIFLENKRKKEEFYYKKNWNEIDFFIPKENKNIQVCFELNNENFERETKWLLLQEWKKELIYFDLNWNFSINEELEINNFLNNNF